MSMLFGGIFALSLLAAFIIFLPWLSNRTFAVTSEDEINIQLTRQRLIEIAREQDEGLVAGDARQAAEREMKQALVNESVGERANKTKGISKPVLFVTIIVSAFVVISTYYSSNQLRQLKGWQGAMERLPELSKRAVTDGDASVTREDLQQFALGLRTKLADKPDDAIGWMLLGRVLAELRFIQPAIESYEKSLAIEPNKAGTLMSYSQSLLMSGEEGNVKHAFNLLKRLIKQSPDDRSILGLLAVAAMQTGNSAIAIDSWSKLLAQLSETDPMRELIIERLDSLKGDVETNDVGLSVSVVVDIEDAMREKMPEEGYLFVFAQDASNNVKVPAAVVKMPLDALPVQIQLNDSNAMLPNYKLSSLKEARLVARISEDGDVSSSKGELQGEFVVSLEQELKSTTKIMINKVLAQ